jgi:hypothetical protein
MTDQHETAFERAKREAPKGLAAEFWGFLRQNKKFYLVPLVLVLLVMAGVIFLGGTAAAPFIYQLF